MIKLDLQSDFGNTVDILWVLSSEIRLRILQLLFNGKEYRLKDLLNYVDCGLSNLSQQVKILEQAGFIEKIRIKDGSTAKMLKPMYEKICINF